ERTSHPRCAGELRLDGDDDCRFRRPQGLAGLARPQAARADRLRTQRDQVAGDRADRNGRYEGTHSQAGVDRLMHRPL
ncbi:MAG: hypothetical protein AVDCRST_MAG23-472, partial [uncultured Sphingosinicella sp.]